MFLVVLDIEEDGVGLAGGVSGDELVEEGALSEMEGEEEEGAEAEGDDEEEGAVVGAVDIGHALTDDEGGVGGAEASGEGDGGVGDEGE